MKSKKIKQPIDEKDLENAARIWAQRLLHDTNSPVSPPPGLENNPAWRLGSDEFRRTTVLCVKAMALRLLTDAGYPERLVNKIVFK